MKFSFNKKKVITYSVIVGVGLVYYVFTQLTGLYIPCPVYTVTGLACPGCGISHFITDMLAFKPLEAIQQNYAVAVLLPVYVVMSICLLFMKDKRKKERVKNTIAIISLVFVIAFGILRNIPAFSFLMPLYMR